MFLGWSVAYFWWNQDDLNNTEEICQVSHYGLYWLVQSKKTQFSLEKSLSARKLHTTWKLCILQPYLKWERWRLRVKLQHETNKKKPKTTTKKSQLWRSGWVMRRWRIKKQRALAKTGTLQQRLLNDKRTSWKGIYQLSTTSQDHAVRFSSSYNTITLSKRPIQKAITHH